MRSPLPSAIVRAVLGPTLAILLALVAVGCGTAAPSFDPTGPCTSDGQAPGAYPDLEALVPTEFDGRPPDRLDSGRSCTPANLGTLARHGVEELRFAGGLWELSNRSGATLAVFTADALDSARLGEFYETGARAARKTEEIETERFEIGGRDAFRVDTLNDESFQTIVVWSSPDPGLVRAALVASSIREIETREQHEAAVTRAIAAFEGG